MKMIMKKDDLGDITFIKLPKALFTNKRYDGMRIEGKVLYGILLNLINLSIENNMRNKWGEPYIKLSRKKIMTMLNIKGSNKVAAVMKELKETGLISEKICGLNKCNEIYLYKIEEIKGNSDRECNKGEEVIKEGDLKEERFLKEKSLKMESSEDILKEYIMGNEEAKEEKSEGLSNESRDTSNKRENIAGVKDKLYGVNSKESFKKKSNSYKREDESLNEYINYEVKGENNSNEIIDLEAFKKNEENRDASKNYCNLEVEYKEDSKEKTNTTILKHNKRGKNSVKIQCDYNDLEDEGINNHKKLKGIRSKEESNDKDDFSIKDSLFKINNQEQSKKSFKTSENKLDIKTNNKKTYINRTSHKESKKTKRESDLDEDIKLLKELYKYYTLSDDEAKLILRIARGNIYIADLAYEKTVERIDKVENFIGYNITLIKAML